MGIAVSPQMAGLQQQDCTTLQRSTTGGALTFCTASRSPFCTSRTAWVFWSPEWLQRKLWKPSSLISHLVPLCLHAYSVRR